MADEITKARGIENGPFLSFAEARNFLSKPYQKLLSSLKSIEKQLRISRIPIHKHIGDSPYINAIE